MASRPGAGVLWCLNLDAEDELRHGLGYTPSAKTLAAVAAARDGARGLLAPADRLIDDLVAGDAWAGQAEGRAWCPTPSAIARLVAAGAHAPQAPGLDTLRVANASRFPYDVLGARLSGARVVTTLDAAEAWLTARAATEPVWLKRAFGAAGRGKLRAFGGPLAPHTRAFLTPAELRRGLVVEPHVDIELEVSQHGLLARDGALVVGDPCVQQVEGGRFLCVRRAHHGELLPTEVSALHGTLEQLAAALHDVGYFGPFGVDAYRYRDAAGDTRWNPCGELNARYTMGFAVGMAGRW